MISSSQVTLSESKITIDKTPPPTQLQTQQQPKKAEEQTQRSQLHNNNIKKHGENQECSEESKDDHDINWRGNDDNNVNENNISIETLNFIRLFVIRRIIDKYIKTSKDKKQETKEETIKELANVFKENKKNELLVISIVTSLINDGIKEYMSKYYDEKKQANIIEDIFNKIILKKFSQEYNEMIKYGTNKLNNKTNDNYFENLLFNSSDLMNQIFQYLGWGKNFDGDLFKCSLVSSHWLYLVWNVNSVYYFNFKNLFRHCDISNRKWRRICQRLYNVKSIEIEFDLRYRHSNYKAVLTTVNKLSMFRKVDKVNVVACGNEADKCVSTVVALMNRCKDRIKYCRIKIDGRYFNSSQAKTSSPTTLRLPKAQYVEIRDLFLYRQWTNECTRLKLSHVDDIGKDWCKFVIENCDCSNISNLILYNVTFDHNSINREIVKKFALKFYNLKTLDIKFFFAVCDNMLIFWQSLKPILSKNKTKVQLEVDYLQNEGEYRLITERMNEKDLKIDKLIVSGVSNFKYKLNDTIKLIQERDNRGLNYLAINANEISGIAIQKLLDELKCKSITTFELKGRNINVTGINQLLGWKMVAQKQILVIIDVDALYWQHGNNDDQVLSLFKQLCENVYQAFMQKIAFYIKIEFRIKDSKLLCSCLSLYSSYFENTQFLSKYIKPNCSNNLCLPRDKSHTYLEINDSRAYFVFSAGNVQMK